VQTVREGLAEALKGDSEYGSTVRMKKPVVVGLLLLLAGLSCFAVGTGGNIVPTVSASSLSVKSTSALSSGFNYTVTLTTSKGTIVIGLFDDMPITTGNFKNLTQLGVYDGTIFHRVAYNFVIQGGDVSWKGIVVPTIHDELPNKHSNVRGSVAMAKTSLPNSATSQFFINLVDNTYLDSNYSVFGQVVQGMDVVDAIGQVPITPTNPQYPNDGKPVQDVTVQTARLQAVPEYVAWVFLVVFIAVALFAVMIHKKTREKDRPAFA
jgi:cyclophilin family peptidyl-prolyl cis-trans isomerase